MKNEVIILAIVMAICIAFNADPKYKKDGIYYGKSQSHYKDEPFVGFSKVTIAKGKIEKIDFRIIDTSKNELFDSTYEKHFTGNEEYINQCRSDWKGVTYYPARLLITQRLNRVDAISGATWSCNLFKSSVSIALKEAGN